MSLRWTGYITQDRYVLFLIFFPCLSVKLGLNIWLLNSKDYAICYLKILIGIPISHSVPHWELQTLWPCPPPPGFSGHSWQPVPPEPAALPSLPLWTLRSQQATGLVLFVGHRGRAEMTSEAIKVTQRQSVPRRLKIKQLRSHYLSLRLLPLRLRSRSCLTSSCSSNCCFSVSTSCDCWLISSSLEWWWKI